MRWFVAFILTVCASASVVVFSRDAAAEPDRTALIGFTASPQSPSAGQDVMVMARFKPDMRPRQGSVTLTLLGRDGGVVREWGERELNPAFLTPVEGGTGEWLYRASFTAQPGYAELRLAWRPSNGSDQGDPERAVLTLSVGGNGTPLGGGGLVSWRVTRDARHDGDEMRTNALFERQPDSDSVRLIIERRGLFSGLYDDRTLYPEREGYEDGRYGGRWSVRFEFTAERGRHRMKLRWRMDGTEYEHIEKFSVDDGALGSNGCDAGASGLLGLSALAPLALRRRREKRRTMAWSPMISVRGEREASNR